MKKYVPILAVFVLALSGCASKARVITSPLVPAAVGDLKISTDGNANTKVKLEVKYLAPPSSLSPPRSAYVVWTRTGSGTPEKQGVLQIGDNREGKIEFITSARAFQLVVTAEDSGAVTYPSSAVTMEADVSR